MPAIIRIEGVEELLKKLDPALLAPVVREGFQEIGALAQPEIKGRAPVWSGKLARSVKVDIDAWHVIPEFVKIGPTQHHTHLVELGVQPHFPPWRFGFGKDKGQKGAARLRQWVIEKWQPAVQPRKGRTAQQVLQGLTAEEQRDARVAALDRATFLLARAISRRGIRGRFFIQGAKQAVEPQIQGEVDRMVDHLEAEWDRIGGPVG
mgnify:CR=1 FL=1